MLFVQINTSAVQNINESTVIKWLKVRTHLGTNSNLTYFPFHYTTMNLIKYI